MLVTSSPTLPLDSGDTSPSADQQPVKEEEKALRNQVAQLEAQLSELKTQHMTESDVAAAELLQAKAKTNSLMRAGRKQQMEVAAVQSFITECSISISERLGHLTVRDDYDVVDGAAFNSRITSKDANGITTESNTVSLMQFFEHGDRRFGGKPCAIVASNCVDEDELYPYRPSTHVRKDISGAMVLSVCEQSKRDQEGEDTSDEEGIVVTMRRAGVLKLHRAAFPIAPRAQQELEEGIADWGKVMIKTMRSVLYA